jgi:hypothetical protein
MHEMSKWEFFLNNPEWVSVFASAVFAIVTVYIIWRQKVAMEQQVEVTKKLGQASARHERLQNRLIKLQHEHEWLTAMNIKREAILKTATKLHIDMLYIMGNHRLGRDNEIWSSLLASRSELKLQLEILDTAAYSTLKSGWYEQLGVWANALFAIIGEDFKTSQTPGFPTELTRKALTEMENSLNPVSAIYALQLTIKESTMEFSKKWDAETDEATVIGTGVGSSTRH